MRVEARAGRWYRIYRVSGCNRSCSVLKHASTAFCRANAPAGLPGTSDIQFATLRERRRTVWH